VSFWQTCIAEPHFTVDASSLHLLPCSPHVTNLYQSFQVLAEVTIAMLTTADASDVIAINMLCTLGYAMETSVQRM